MPNRKERLQRVSDALSKIRERNKFGIGRVTQSDIGRCIGVHQNTVARWERNVMLPDDEETVSKIETLSCHVNDWHLLVGQFVIIKSDPDDSNLLVSLIYTPTNDPKTVKVDAKTKKKMNIVSLSAIGSDRNRSYLSIDGKHFSDTITFDSKISDLSFFIRFDK